MKFTKAQRARAIVQPGKAKYQYSLEDMFDRHWADWLDKHCQDGMELWCLSFPREQFIPDPSRMFCWDRAWIDERLLLDIQGGEWTDKSGHRTGRGLTRDCEKALHAAALGYRVCYLTGEQVRRDLGFDVLLAALRWAK